MAQRSLAEQARQNERLAQQSQQVVEASQQLIEADAEARQQMISAHAVLQQEIQQSRDEIEQQRDELERERRAIAQQRQRDPVVAESVQLLALLLACSLPLLLAGYVLYTANRATEQDASLEELLAHELIYPEPLSLPAAQSPPQLEHRSSDGRPAA
jgi:hypothetical protein